MDYWFIDYETYYSTEYSLRRMTVPEYILDPRFECMGAAVKKRGAGDAKWIDATDLPAFFASLDPDNVALISHNALFDACITSWVFGFVPRLTGDTLAVSRAVLAHELKSLSLGSVAAHLGVGVKGDTIMKVQGMNSVAIKQARLWDQYTAYAENDAEQCANIWEELVVNRKFPARELVLIDKLIRCTIQPKFRLDPNVLHLHLAEVKAKKEALLQRVGLTSRDDLMSNDKFAVALMQLGVDPPRKTSLTTGNETWAFAKTDPGFIELEEHENPEVQALVAARLGVKTTLEETRTERFIRFSQLPWPQGEPCMPFPLRYGGAHTHRLSGDWKLNLQNLPRGGNLRRALVAPPGHKIIAPDSSQIEARVAAWLGKEQELLQSFREKRDIYSEFASEVFGYPVSKPMKKERFLGKTSILGLGYGMGWAKFKATVKVQSRLQIGEEIVLSDADALRIVETYRSRHNGIASTWRQLNVAGINALASGGGFTLGPCVFEKEKITLPSGLHLHYHGLKLDPAKNEWVYSYGPLPKRTYGGKLMENITQSLARIIVMDAAIEIEKRFQQLGYPVGLAGQVHDELIYVVPDEIVDDCKRIAEEEMCRPPVWAPDLPLGSECDVGQNYADAK